MDRVRHARHDWVSPGLVTGLDAAAGPAEAGMVRDPDQHAVLIGAP